LQKIALAALFLAAKLEDSPKQMRDILAVFHYLENRGRDPPVPFLDVGSTVRSEHVPRIP
jgi:hypothetical protein